MTSPQTKERHKSCDCLAKCLRMFVAGASEYCTNFSKLMHNYYMLYIEVYVSMTCPSSFRDFSWLLFWSPYRFCLRVSPRQNIALHKCLIHPSICIMWSCRSSAVSALVVTHGIIHVSMNMHSTYNITLGSYSITSFTSALTAIVRQNYGHYYYLFLTGEQYTTLCYTWIVSFGVIKLMTFRS